MISSLITVAHLKIKYAINTTFYYSKSNIFKKKQEKIDSYNIYDLIVKAFFNYFAKNFIVTLFLILLLILMPISIVGEFNLDSLFLLIIFSSLSIAILKSPLNDYTEDTLYAIEHIKMKHKNYYLSNYLIKIFWMFIIYFSALSSLYFLMDYDFLNYEIILQLSLIYALIRNVGIFYNIKNFENSKFKYILSIILYVIPLGMIFFGLLIPFGIYNALLIILCILNLFVIYKIFTYKNYKAFYEKVFDKFKRKKVKLKSYETKKLNNEIGFTQVKKNKNPYKNFMNLFDKRYSKVIPKKLGTSSILIFIITIFTVFYMMNNDYLKELIYYNIYFNTSLCILVLCFMNSGKNIVKNMYLKCDIFMNSHNFYLNKKVNKNLYIEKLKYIIKNNLIKTNVLSVSICLLYYLSGFETYIYEYLIIILSINLIMILYSMYYLSSYYLFNPYKHNFDKINPLNLCIIYFPYYIAFNCFNILLPITFFGIAVLFVFVLFSIINFLVLNYKFRK